MKWHRADFTRITAKIAFALCLFLTAAGAFVVGSSSVSAASLNFSANHQLYDRGADILSLQQLLNTSGFVIAQSGPGSLGNETSFFGLGTFQELKAFQAAHGLPSTGYFGPLTRNAINSGSAASSTAAQTTALNTTTNLSTGVVFTHALIEGQSGTDVTELQQALIQQGFLGVGDDTGYFGPLTAKAVVAFQTAHNIDPLGGVGPLTRAALNSLLPTSTSSQHISSTLSTTATTTASTTPPLPAWYTKPLPGYAPGQIIFVGGSTPAPSSPAPPPTTTGACPKGSAYQDGCTNAPTGTAQYPNLLSSYTTRPPWNVAGVDYPVGISSGTSLKDPATINMTGVTVDATDHIIFITGENVTLNGYDFSREGGWLVWAGNDGSAGIGDNFAIENCNFGVGSNGNDMLYIGRYTSGGTIEYNTFNGNGTQTNGTNAAISSGGGSGTFTIQYNLIENGWGDAIDINANPNGATLDVQYNVIENFGLGTSAAHGDMIQTLGQSTSTAVYLGYNVLFNTIVENATSSLGNNLQQGISIGDQSLPVFETADFSNNTAIAESSAIPLSYIYDYVPQQLNGTVNIDYNYVDPTQLSSNQGKFLNINQGGGPYSGTDSRTGNVNMVDGSLPASWNGHLAPTVLLTAPTASSTVSGSAVTLSATASDNISVTNVQFEVDGTKIGSALTSPPYTTTWDSTGSSNGVHTISAVSKDSSGNYATSSASVVVSNSVSYTGPGDIVGGADAWWGLRAYGAATAGTKAIRLARASDGAQENISTLSNGNLDTSTAATFCASTTCTIVTWYDQTGSGFDVTQTATSSEATYTVNCLGTLPCATLPGGTGYSSSGNMTQAQPLTYSVMYDRTFIQEYELVLDNNRNAILGTAAAANQAQITAGSQVTATSTDNVWHAMQGVLNGSSSFFYIDGTQTNVSFGGNSIFSTPIVFLGTASKELVGMATEGGVWGSAFSTTTASSLNSNQHAYWAF